MAKTKIICTIGPATRSPEMIRRLIQAGMDVARLNFSHGSHAEHRRNIDMIAGAAGELNRHVAVMQDLAGQKIRIGEIESGTVTLESGQEFLLTARTVPGDGSRVSVNYPGLPATVKEGDMILLSDGSIELRVTEATQSDLRCSVIRGGKLSSRKGINIPLHSLDIPGFTEKDRSDLDFGIDNGIDLVAHSFVRSAKDVEVVKDYLAQRNSEIPVIAKIENSRAVENIDEILDAVDGIMVARGDLGVETPLEKIPIVQKTIINKSNEAGKPVITATHMLKSMVHDVKPTRAEVADVANAILDGTDGVMLSEETAIGQYPGYAADMMAKIAEHTESSHLFDGVVERFRKYPPGTEREAFGLSICNLSDNIRASAIITYTVSGHTARLISRYRPRQTVTAITPSAATCRNLAGVWGVVPVFDPDSESNGDLDTAGTVRTALKYGAVKPGDKVVITDGISMSMQYV